MILLNELKIKDFISHSDTNLIFKDNQKLLISGISGSGKSSICEAVLFCLYGNGRADNRNLVRKGCKQAIVSLKLIDGNIITIITREVTSMGKNSLSITQNMGTNGQFVAIPRTGLKDLQNWVTDTFLKASEKLFINSIAYLQDNQNSFVKATASERKDLLLEIINVKISMLLRKS